MKIILMQPPIQDFYDTDVRLQPLGLCFLKAVLAERCPEVKVVVRDFHHGWGRRTIPIPRELGYLKKYYSQPNQSPFSSFHQYYHFGLSFEKIAEEIAKENPDLVGISALFSPYYREVFECAAAIRNKTATQIVIGGGQATCSPQLMLGNANIDFIIRGEGERPLVELVKALRSGGDLGQVPNLGYKKDGDMRLNPVSANYPFAELPAPDLSDLPLDRYSYNHAPLTFIQSSRGCPHRCSFCSVHQVFGRQYRRRGPEKIIAEMQQRYREGFRVFDFEDDNLTLDRREILALCALIRQNFSDRKISLLAMNGISYQSLDQEVLTHMRRAGFARLNLALVSSDQRVLKNINRFQDTDKFHGVIRMATELGFELEVHQIIGLPGEELSSMIRTLVVLAQLPVLIGVSLFYLTPGAPIAASFPEMTAGDIFRSRSTAMAVTSAACGRDDLFTLFTTARIINFLKGLPVDDIQLTDILEENNCGQGRVATGVALLRKLLTEKKLYAAGKNGLKLIPRFRYALFEKIRAEAGFITTQRNKNIHVANGSRQ
ncbi:MAG: B12-binding domain-containing radical SAM protein [Deltaproteobacteria bacterium]|nr:B12-binding domain-containing radical SAM protein [Deltaproteobacteria bacterium]